MSNSEQWIEINSDPNALTWYRHEQTSIFPVIESNGTDFQVTHPCGDTLSVPRSDCTVITSVMEFLEKCRVVEFSQDEEDPTLFVVEECCDNYFREKLSRIQLLQLAAELMKLADA